MRRSTVNGVPRNKSTTFSKRTQKRTGRSFVRESREQDKEQRIGYLARPFILCGLPFKKPDKGKTTYKRENGDEILEITATPEMGCPSEWITRC